MPKVSVILTSFNHARYIRAAIDSILAQTYNDFELIIGDDNSSDDSWDIIRSFEHPRIKSFRCEQNTGNVINVALRDGMVRGEYVAIHHSDDLWEPDKLELQTAFMDAHPGITAVFTQALFIDDNNAPIDELYTTDSLTVRNYLKIFDQENKSRHEWLRRFFYSGNCLCHPSAMIRKAGFDDLGLYDTTYRQLPDFDYWVRLCLKYEIHVIPRRLVRYRLHNEAVNTSAATSENMRRMRCEQLRVLLHFTRLQSPSDIQSIFPESLKFFEGTTIVPNYVLARVSLESTDMYVRLFGLQLLNLVLADPVLAAAVREQHPASVLDLNRLLGTVSMIEQSHVELMEFQQATIREKDAHISNIEASRILLEATISQKDDHVRNIESTICLLEGALAQKDIEARNLSLAARADHARIQELGESLVLKENHIQNLSNIIKFHEKSLEKLLLKLTKPTFRNLLLVAKNYIKRTLPKTPLSDQEHIHNIDTPENWKSAPMIGSISGWMAPFPNGSITGVRVRCGLKTWVGQINIPRPDVHAAHPTFGGACGFTIDYQFKKPGRTTLRLEVKDQKGRWQLFSRRELRTIGNKPGYEHWLQLEAHRPVNPCPSAGPLISILVPIYNSPERWLRRAIESVREQSYPNWELCLADDASTQAHIGKLLDTYSKIDARIKVVRRPVNGHISAASNSALALATGAYCALLDHDDELAPYALAEVVLSLQKCPSAKIIYSDEDKIDTEGRRFEPYFKPDWNPDLLRGQNYFCHLCVYQTSLLRELGGFRMGFEGSQDWDLALRATELTPAGEIVHIPKVLYHWRAIPGSTALSTSQKDYHKDAAFKALSDHIARTGIRAEIEPVKGEHWRLKYQLPNPQPLISLIIPTRNRVKILKPCVDSILRLTTYVNYEIIIVDNGSDEQPTLDYFDHLKSNPHIRILRDEGPFNYSKLNNKAARQARGELLALVNNDIEPITPGWLEEMASHALRPEIGAVGALLYYPDDTVQHAGVVLGIAGPKLTEGVAGHAFKKYPRGSEGKFNRMRLVQNYSAVTAACLLIRKSVYEEVGGLDEINLPVGFNDVDFCLRVLRAGYRNLWTPFAELYHYESASRGLDDTPAKISRAQAETKYMRETWGNLLDNDPAYNPNLTIVHEDFSIAPHPRLLR